MITKNPVHQPRTGVEEAVDRLTGTRRVQYDEQCVICQNEGAHDIVDRPHVMEGQE